MHVSHHHTHMSHHHIWRVEAGAHACIRYIQQTCTCTLHTRASTLNPKPCIHVYVCDRQTRATCIYAPHPVSHHHMYMSHHHISSTSVTDKHVQLAHTRHTRCLQGSLVRRDVLEVDHGAGDAARLSRASLAVLTRLRLGGKEAPAHLP